MDRQQITQSISTSLSTILACNQWVDVPGAGGTAHAPCWGDIYQLTKAAQNGLTHLSRAPLPLLEELSDAAGRIGNRAAAVAKFSNPTTPVSAKSQEIQSANTGFPEDARFYLSSVAKVIACAGFTDDGTAQLFESLRLREQDLSSRMNGWHNDIATLQAKMVQMEAAALKLLSLAHQAHGASGAGRFAATFDEQCQKETEAARLWLVSAATATVGAVGLAWALLSARPASGALTDAAGVEHLMTRLLTLGALVTAALWCGRMYKVRSHLAARHRHRALALRTYENFMSAAFDESTKDFVLRNANACIFEMGDTGLVADERDSSVSPLVQLAQSLPGSGELRTGFPVR